MSITISRSIDVEDAIREVLSPYMTVFCPPLPEKFTTPCVLIQSTGGDTDATMTGKGKVDSFVVAVDARAEEEADAMELSILYTRGEVIRCVRIWLCVQRLCLLSHTAKLYFERRIVIIRRRKNGYT